LTHSIPGVAKIPLIGILPVQKVGGMGRLVFLVAYFSEVEVVCREILGQVPRVNVLVKSSKKDNIIVDCFP
jgi:hypothetical protein